ncbi:MAG TPA: hypothetical protein VMG35_28825, partial [Bryobacteraceae bacterium]|nr:hypothetical protein [Bryobacteraceae bacterium]
MVYAISQGMLEMINRNMPAGSRQKGEFGDLFESAPVPEAVTAAHTATPETVTHSTVTHDPVTSDSTTHTDSVPLQPAGQSTAAATNPADVIANQPHTLSEAQNSLADPDVQDWLNSYYAERGDPNSASIPWQPAAGAGSNYNADSLYGPDQIYTQALYNQNGYLFATQTGMNPANLTSQLPPIPSEAVQNEYDHLLATQNAERLASGQPIDTAAYWSDPGPVTLNGVTYTSQELGYAGPGQSSGPEPIYISIGHQIPGTDKFSVPGYSGTVTGIQPNRYYTLQQLEQAGLQVGQPDAQYHP